MPTNIQASLSKAMSSIETGVAAAKHISEQKKANAERGEYKEMQGELSRSQIAANNAEKSLKEALTARIQAMAKADSQREKLRRSIERQKLKQEKIITEQMKGDK